MSATCCCHPCCCKTHASRAETVTDGTAGALTTEGVLQVGNPSTRARDGMLHLQLRQP
jgi:hypothetical protein